MRHHDRRFIYHITSSMASLLRGRNWFAYLKKLSDRRIIKFSPPDATDAIASIAALWVIVIFAFPVLAEPSLLTGTVTKVRDGDTIEVGKIPIRLNGVSAPEMNEPLGPQSKGFMTDLVMGKRVRCELDGSKTHDRFVGICYLDEQDIGATLISNGLAMDCPRYSGGRYAKFEVEGAAAQMKLPGYCR